MLLKSITINNIRSYNHAKIDLRNGSTLLLGDIGSGKTTILLAIEFALFGLIKGDVSGSTLLRHGKNEGSVELDFSIGKDEIKIHRKLKRKKDTISQDSGYILVNNKKTESTPVELKSKILELFGYPQELLNKNTSLIYRYTVYTPQEEMKNILYESREERLDILRKIFNIDKYKRIRENALFYAKELRTNKKILESKITDFEDKKSLLEERENIIITKETEKDSQKQLLESLKKDYEETNSKLKTFEEKIKNLNDLKNKSMIVENQLKSKIEEQKRLEKELNMIMYRINDFGSRLKEMPPIIDDEKDIKSKLDDSENKLSKINNAKQLIEERLNSKKDDLKKFVIEDSVSLKYRKDTIIKKLDFKDEKEKEYDIALKNLENIGLDINTAKLNNNNSHRIINQIKDLSTCPVCLQNVDFTHKINITDRENILIASNDRKLKELETKKIELESKIRRIRAELEDMHRSEIELKEINMKIQSLSELRDNKQKLEAEIKDLEEKKLKLDAMDVNKLIDQISLQRKILNTIGVRKHIEESLKEKHSQKTENENSINKVLEDLKNFKSDLEIISEQIQSYSDIESQYNSYKKDFEQTSTKLKDQELNHKLLLKDIQFINDEIKNIKKELELKEKIKQKINYINELNYWLTEQFINLTSTIEKNIMFKVQREFNELFKKWFSLIIEDENLDVQIDEDFAPLIRQNNYDTFIENLSGGEKTAIALAYRLALNKTINDFINTIKTKDIIILDEPTDGFSSEQLDRMRDVFEQLNINQLIIVSHEAKMETYAENIIRISKHEHVSGAVG
ncbi:TPA: SMC family ATPase [Candidatus Woesearchaeota archaeon]|nr:SMC family ATPase [Candidatus Woesearchaeota archaeon]HIH31963.1 SMC family ATPase [Candidatus Woesearchaeota archaeon]HIH54480.1 SMC family ATPase [Candidatus Woesearchaeota archaeon]HIJ02119.1 SMC family ATPase [Candidatus Woesearchaeota archaeon]HIJ13167.1 SMC family ATPase [Candidatus Woesearchaeota archaeon]